MRFTFHAAVAILILILATGALGQMSSDQSSTEAQIRALDEQQRQSALKQDAGFMEKHLATNYIGIDPQGNQVSREEAIQSRKAGKVKYDDIQVKDTSVRVYGNTAIVTHEAFVKGMREGKQFGGDHRATFVWVKQGNEWKLASSEITPVQGAPQAAEK